MSLVSALRVNRPHVNLIVSGKNDRDGGTVTPLTRFLPSPISKQVGLHYCVLRARQWSRSTQPSNDNPTNYREMKDDSWSSTVGGQMRTRLKQSTLTATYRLRFDYYSVLKPHIVVMRHGPAGGAAEYGRSLEIEIWRNFRPGFWKLPCALNQNKIDYKCLLILLFNIDGCFVTTGG